MSVRGLLRLPDLAEAAALVAAIEEGSLARAGARLGVSQPAMTKRIRALEALVGTSLLERDPRGVRPTPAGRRLYDDASRLLAEADRFARAAAALRAGPPPLRVATIFTLAETAVPRWLACWRAAGHEGPVEVRVGHPEQVRRWVAAGESDLGFAATWPIATDDDGQLADYPRLGLEERAIALDELVAVVPAGHPWADAGEVDAGTLAETPMIAREEESGVRELLEDALSRAGLPGLRPALTLGSTPAIRAAVAEQGIPSVLSRRSVAGEPGLRAVPVRGLDLVRAVTVLRRKGTRPTSAERAFLQAAETCEGAGTAVRIPEQ
jgi:DNA-binding transcriptional LysR family regulator